MGEISTEIPDSLIPAATEKAERISHAVRRLSAAVQIELIDTDLNPADLDDTRREELAQLGNELLGFMHLGHSLLREIVEAGTLGVEENGGGLPLRITAGTEMLELEPGSPNGDGEVTEPVAEEEPKEPAAEEEPAESPEPPEPKTEAETKPDLPDIELIIDGLAQLDNRELGLTSIHEVNVLKALAELKGEPLTRRWMMERGFYQNAVSDAARSQAFSKAAVGLSAKLEIATGGLKVLDIVGEKSKRRYLVRTPFKINGAEVEVSDEVKKN